MAKSHRKAKIIVVMPAYNAAKTVKKTVKDIPAGLKGGMTFHKYFFNRLYSLVANFILGVNFSEHMSGLRAYSIRTLRKVPFQRFSNGFVFDQQFTVSAICKGLKIGEVPIPVRYYQDSSSIGWKKGLGFGFSSL